MRLTDEQIVTLRAQSVHWWPFTETDDIHALATEVLESRAALALNTATHSRISADYTQTIRALEARVAELEGALVSIQEYWNGSRTDGAMSDALDYITETARAALGRDAT